MCTFSSEVVQVFRFGRGVIFVCTIGDDMMSVCHDGRQSHLCPLHDCRFIYKFICSIITLMPHKLASTCGAQKATDQSAKREMPEDLNLKCTENITRGHSNWSLGYLVIFFTSAPPNIRCTQDDHISGQRIVQYSEGNDAWWGAKLRPVSSKNLAFYLKSDFLWPRLKFPQ